MKKEEIAWAITMVVAGLIVYEFAGRPLVNWVVGMFRPAAKTA